MRGTEYAIAEIIWWMLAAAVIGGVIGWLLHYWAGGGRSRKEAEAKIEAQRGRYAEISEELGKWKVKGEKLISDLDAKTEEVGALSGRNEELEASLQTVRHDLSEAQDRTSQMSADLDASTAEKDAEISRLGAEVAGLAGLEATIAERDTQLDDLRSRIGDLESRLARETNELASIQADHAGCGVTVDGFTGQVAALESKVAELEADNAELRQQEAASTAAPPTGTDLEALAAAEEDDVDSAGQLALASSEATIAVATAPLTRFGTAGADHKDDLKVINGIGPKLEGVLNGYGIESWEQLAALTEDEIGAVDEALEEFPGRIQRDEWVEQARDLVKRFPDKIGRPDRKTFLNESRS